MVRNQVYVKTRERCHNVLEASSAYFDVADKASKYVMAGNHTHDRVLCNSVRLTLHTNTNRGRRVGEGPFIALTSLYNNHTCTWRTL